MAIGPPTFGLICTTKSGDKDTGRDEADRRAVLINFSSRAYRFPNDGSTTSPPWGKTFLERAVHIEVLPFLLARAI